MRMDVWRPTELIRATITIIRVRKHVAVTEAAATVASSVATRRSCVCVCDATQVPDTHNSIMLVRGRSKIYITTHARSRIVVNATRAYIYIYLGSITVLSMTDTEIPSSLHNSCRGERQNRRAPFVLLTGSTRAYTDGRERRSRYTHARIYIYCGSRSYVRPRDTVERTKTREERLGRANHHHHHHPASFPLYARRGWDARK